MLGYSPYIRYNHIFTVNKTVNDHISQYYKFIYA